jgi:hypothetical protein
MTKVSRHMARDTSIRRAWYVMRRAQKMSQDTRLQGYKVTK